MDADENIYAVSDDLFVHRGAINVGLLRGERGTLMFGFEADALDAASSLGLPRVARVMLTHYHRDEFAGLDQVPSRLEIFVPEDERWLFEDPEKFWGDPSARWHIYDFRPSHMAPVSPVAPTRGLSEGDAVDWNPFKVEVRSTPGHTDGSLTYVVSLNPDGPKVAFCGDLICGDGRLWEIYSLQKGVGTSDYHGFMGALPELKASLGRLEDEKLDLLVPTHGGLVQRPLQAIPNLRKRLDQCYSLYASASSLRHYFPHLFPKYIPGQDSVPFERTLPVPPFLRHIGTSWILTSSDGSCFVMDCGSAEVAQSLRELIARGEIRGIDQLWITHYHDDHVDGIGQLREAFDFEVVAEEHVAMVVQNPRHWRLPCISPNRVEVDRTTGDGERWKWREFTLTSYYLPGQTLYHGGLLVEGRGVRMFFSGDSFTMAGLDDYCCQNRNLLGDGVGYHRCLSILEKDRPDMVFNSHVDVPFALGPGMISKLRENLRQRRLALQELIQRDDPNFGIDEGWISCVPYEYDCSPGQTVEVTVVVMNHSTKTRLATCWLRPPRGWDRSTSSRSTRIPPKKEGKLILPVTVPDIPPGRHIITVDVKLGSAVLPSRCEAVLAVR